MGCKLLRGLCALFSEQNPYIKIKNQPFLDALSPVKNILEQSNNPQWKSLAERLGTASSTPSRATEHFIYPISGSREIYLRRTTLEDLQAACELIHQNHLDLLEKNSPSSDLWNKALDTLLNVSEILKTGKQAASQPRLEQSPRYPAQSLMYNPL